MMRRASVLVSMVVVALLGLVGGHTLGAVAGEDTPEPVGPGFAGSWLVTVSGVDGQPAFPILMTLMADGTVLASAPAAPPAVPGAAPTPVFTSAGHGGWVPTREDTASVTFVALRTDERGAFLGTVSFVGTQRLEEHGVKFSGEYTIQVLDPAKRGAEFSATLHGAFIGVTVLPPPAAPVAETPAP